MSQAHSFVLRLCQVTYNNLRVMHLLLDKDSIGHPVHLIQISIMPRLSLSRETLEQE